MDKIYICGHRHPDTDSIVSSIAYAYLKKSLVIMQLPVDYQSVILKQTIY